MGKNGRTDTYTARHKAIAKGLGVSPKGISMLARGVAAGGCLTGGGTAAEALRKRHLVETNGRLTDAGVAIVARARAAGW